MILALLLACGTAEPEPASDGDLGAAAASETAEAAAVVATARPRRRMNVDQLSASIEVATGERWRELDETGAQVELFERLSGSLGKPDFLDSTAEDLSPGLLYQKFLSDAANATCYDMLRAEAERDPDDRLLVVDSDLFGLPQDDPEGTTADLQRALLRFHGRSLDADAEELELWRWLLHEATAQTGEASRGWRSVCVALITHPDFSSF